VSGRPDGWIGWTTTGCVALLAVIAGTVSYLHMHMLVAAHGQPGWVAALTPLSVDGMMVAASTALLAESRSGGRGGLLPWALLLPGAWRAWRRRWRWPSRWGRLVKRAGAAGEFATERSLRLIDQRLSSAQSE